MRARCVASDDNLSVSYSGATPTHLAARAGHAEVLRLLTTAGADPTVQDSYGRTPLHEVGAAIWGLGLRF